MKKVNDTQSTLIRKKRNKGLGETSPQAMQYALNHCMHQVTIHNLKQALTTQNLWFHKEYAAKRRQAISQYAQLFFDD